MQVGWGPANGGDKHIIPLMQLDVAFKGSDIPGSTIIGMGTTGHFPTRIMHSDGGSIEIGSNVVVDTNLSVWGDLYITGKSHLQPIGSVVTTSTKTNPSSCFAGTWELIDKEFEPKLFNSESDSSIVAFENATGGKVFITRAGHSLLFHVEFTVGQDVTDSTLRWLTINKEKIGLPSGTVWSPRFILYTDGGNGMAPGYLNYSDLAIITVDYDTRGGGIIPADSYLYADFTVVCRPGMMDDSACNKFYWKRTA